MIAILLAAAVVAPSPPLSFRCPAPVPIVGDVRRTQVDELFFAVMARAEAAGRMPVQADVDAAVAADAGLAASPQPDGYTPTNVLLYRLSPFRAAFYTTETWGYSIEQRTLDASPVITDSEATFRRTGSDLTAIRSAMSVVRGWRVGHPGRVPRTSRLVADMLHRGVNEGRVTAIAETGTPHTGWIGVWSSPDHQQVLVRGRTCSKLLDMRETAGTVPPPAHAVCPSNGRVAVADRRRARGVFDDAVQAALVAGDPVADGFTVTSRATGGGIYRIEWLGIDLPVIVTSTNERRDDAVAGFRWMVDRVAASLHRRHGRYATAHRLARRRVPGVRIRVVALRGRHGDPGRGRAGIWVAPDGRVALVRGRLCGATVTSYATT